MGTLAWALGWGVAGVVAAVLVFLLLWRARQGRRGRREMAHKARQLRGLQKEATHDLVRRLTDYQDLDRWQQDFDDWCRRAGERLAREFSEHDREMFDAAQEPPPASLARSKQPRRDGLRLMLTEKVRRLEIVIGRHLGAE
jgi:hypothetical protein